MLRTILALTFVTGLLLSLTTHASLVKYSYVGPDFDRPSPLQLPYEAGDHVEGFITIDDAFLDSAGDGVLTATSDAPPPDWLLDIQFTDGVNKVTASDLKNLAFYQLSLWFDNSQLRAWDVFLAESIDTGNRITMGTRCGELSADFGIYCGDVGSKGSIDSAQIKLVQAWWSTDVARTTNTTWTRHVVPLPGAIWLFSSGLIGLVGIARSRRKA